MKVAWLVVMALLLAGCEGWPLYAHLPDPSVSLPDPELRTVVEDATLGDDEVQDLGALSTPSIVTITGAADACGFDLDDASFDWPEHPVDLDGDGVEDDVAALQGWYSGDVDLFGVTATDEGWLDVTLSWDLAPPGDLNAPYQPSDEDGAWADEADLDFVIFDSADGVIGAIRSDAGVTRRHPERSAQLLRLEAGEGAVIAVACHHEQPSDYTLEIDLGLP